MQLNKNRCILDLNTIKEDSAYTMLVRGLFSSKDRLYLMAPLLIRVLSIASLYDKFPFSKNRACQFRIVLRVPGFSS